MATPIKGSVVSVRKSTSAFGGVGEYTLTVEASVADITEFGQANRTRTMVLKDWSGDFSGFYDRTDTQQASIVNQFSSSGVLADTTEIRLYDSTGGYWYGAAVLPTWTLRAVTDGVLEVSFTFQGDGALSHST